MPISPRLLPELRFGSFLVCSPRGTSAVSRYSSDVCYGVKQDSGSAIARCVSRLASLFASTPLGEVLGPDVTLIPAPRSTPLVAGALWPGKRIADELVARGLGAEVVTVVHRVSAVEKSAYVAAGNRPLPARHLETLELGATDLLFAPARVTIVDDVVTKGSMLLATASLVAHRFPNAQVCAFALVRTLGRHPEVERIIDPCVGYIALTPSGDVDRVP